MDLVKMADGPSPSSRPALVDVATRLGEVEVLLAGLAGDLVPERVPGHALERVMGVLGRIERRAGGARL
ncbi:MAG TPA: hypothetical protein VEW93_08280, partial [Acidimicrobiales bacterium]|nr:hypothetical protein [Acidimicrobiales bacterium]